MNQSSEHPRQVFFEKYNAREVTSQFSGVFPGSTDTYQTPTNCAVVIYMRVFVIKKIRTNPDSRSVQIEFEIEAEIFRNNFIYFLKIVPFESIEFKTIADVFRESLHYSSQ
jgi:hypothetical protein